MSATVCISAVDNEAWECLKYLVDNKCPNWDGGDAMYWYAMHFE